MLEDFNNRQGALKRGPTLWDALDPAVQAEWDARLKERADSLIPRKSREAMEKAKAAGGAVQFGAAASRRRNLAEVQRAARERRRAERLAALGGEEQQADGGAAPAEGSG